MTSIERQPKQPLRPTPPKVRKSPPSQQRAASANGVGISPPNNNYSRHNSSDYSEIARAALENNNMPRPDDDRFFNAANAISALPRIPLCSAPLHRQMPERRDNAVRIRDARRHPAQDDELDLILRKMLGPVTLLIEKFPMETLSAISDTASSPSSGSSSTSSDGNSSSSDGSSSSSDGSNSSSDSNSLSSSESEDEKKDTPAVPTPAVPTLAVRSKLPVLRAANSGILPSERLSNSEEEKPMDAEAVGVRVQQVRLDGVELKVSDSESSDDEQKAKNQVSGCEQAAEQQKSTVSSSSSSSSDGSSSDGSSSSSDGSNSSSDSNSLSSSESEDEKKDTPAVPTPAVPTLAVRSKLPVLRAANSGILPSERLSNSEEEKPMDAEAVGVRVQQVRLDGVELKVSDSESSDDEQKAKNQVSGCEQAAEQQKSTVSSSSSSSSDGSSSDGSSSSSDGSNSSSDSNSLSSSESEDEKKDTPAVPTPAVPTLAVRSKLPVLRAANSGILPSERLSNSEEEKPMDAEAVGVRVQQVRLDGVELKVSDSESSDDEQKAKNQVSGCEQAAEQQKSTVSSSSSSSSFSSSSSSSGSSSSSRSSSSSGSDSESSSSRSDSEEEETAGVVSEKKANSEVESLRAKSPEQLKLETEPQKNVVKVESPRKAGFVIAAVEKVTKEEVKDVLSSEKWPKKLSVESERESDANAKNTKKQSMKEADERKYLRIPSSELESEKKIEKIALISEKPKVSRASSESEDEAIKADRPKKFRKKLNKKIKILFGDDSDSDYDVRAERPYRVKPKSRSISQTAAAVEIKRKASPIKDKNLKQPAKYIKLQLKHESDSDRNIDFKNSKDLVSEVKGEKKSVCSVDKSLRVPKESRTDKDTDISEKKLVCSVDTSARVPKGSRTDKDMISNEKKLLHRLTKSSSVTKRLIDGKSDANKSEKESTCIVDISSSETKKSVDGGTWLDTSEKKSVASINKNCEVPKKYMKEKSISRPDSEHQKKPKQAEEKNPPTTVEKKSSREPKKSKEPKLKSNSEVLAKSKTLKEKESVSVYSEKASPRVDKITLKITMPKISAESKDKKASDKSEQKASFSVSVNSKSSLTTKEKSVTVKSEVKPLPVRKKKSKSSKSKPKSRVVISTDTEDEEVTIKCDQKPSPQNPSPKIEKRKSQEKDRKPMIRHVPKDEKKPIIKSEPDVSPPIIKCENQPTKARATRVPSNPTCSSSNSGSESPPLTANKKLALRMVFRRSGSSWRVAAVTGYDPRERYGGVDDELFAGFAVKKPWEVVN